MLSTEMQKLKQQNYFPIPNAVFDIDLTDGEILVYAFLLRCEDRRTYQCHPSYTTIGRAIGKSVNSVRKYVQGLTQKGLITTEHTQIITKSGETRNGTLLYTILPIQQVMDRQFERQMTLAMMESRKQEVESVLQNTKDS
ncbi:MAG: helix-turn-helix domain-containing protein [Clostridia bacterium]|nr:helix-turn-helix domain-containing protein [Clostridia bacterium]